jgi:Tfp pilus assembly protein PilF
MSSRSIRILTLILSTLSPSILPAQDFSQPESKPAPSTTLIQQANDALTAGDFPAALKLLTNLNSQTPNNPEILYDLGQTLEALADTPTAATNPQPATAESWYRKSIAANPLFPPPHAALGLLLARTNHPTEAHAELASAITLPDATSALKARALRALARIDETANTAAASDELLAALKLTPEQPEDILLAAEIAEAATELPTAEQAYRRYLALNPQDPAAIAALAHILLAEHHSAEAETLLTSAIAAHPADPTLTAQLAAAYLASGDPAKVAQAAPLLEALHTKNPTDPNITRLLARVYVETGHPDQADSLYAALISAQSQSGTHPDPTLLDDRAELLLRQHRPAEAEALLKQAVANPAAFPTPAAFGDAATHLAFAASEIDDPKEALQALTLRSTVLPPSPSTLFLEATANDTLHQSVKAVDLYKQFLAAAHGDFPEQESQARQRLAALPHRN